MKHLRLYTIGLLLDLSIFFNIERLDYRSDNIIDIQSFVYVLTVIAVASFFVVPPLWRGSGYISVLLWVSTYFICRLVIFYRGPLIGSPNMYIVITELYFFSTSVLLAYRVSRCFHDFEQAVENITFTNTTRRVRQLEEATEDVQIELVRSRRYQRPLSVLVVEPLPGSIQVALHRTVQEVQRAMMGRYVLMSLARLVSNELRRTDLVLEQRDRGRFIILSPETDADRSSILANRIQLVATEQLGMSIACGVASFPDGAFTFEELVARAEANLHPPVRAPDLPSHTIPERNQALTPSQ